MSSSPARRSSFPPWLHRPLPRTNRGSRVESALRDLRLHTICEEARCPNRSECYERGTATFLVLGDVCTRGCRFCAVGRGKPEPPSPDEGARLAEAVSRLGLRHVVITMVTRDDLPDGGAAHVAGAIREVRERTGAVVEVLISDLGGNRGAVEEVLRARPEIFNHNVETVPRLYSRVRPGSDYLRSLAVLELAARSGILTKSGLMVGLGEEPAEVEALLGDLRQRGVSLLTIGQYLSPGPRHLPVAEFITPETFDAYARRGRALGFTDVFSGPYVRSSYLAERALARIEAGREASPWSLREASGIGTDPGTAKGSDVHRL